MRHEATREEVSRRHWERRFDQLLAYKALHGHCDVSRSTALNDGQYKWVVKQRKLRSEGLLPADLERRLTEVGFVWETPPVFGPADFDRLVRDIRNFKLEHGTANIPLSYSQCKDPEYGWAAQRLHYLRRKQGLHLITAEMLHRLVALGVDFAPKQFRDTDTWDRNLAQYKALRAAGVDFSRGETYADLRSWLSSQRYRARNGQLSAERREQLLAAGIDIEAPIPRARPVSSLSAGHDRLQAYAGLNFIERALLSPARNVDLWRWEWRQRKRRREGRLSAERIAALEAIGFYWSRKDQLTNALKRFGAAYFRLNETFLGAAAPVLAAQLERSDADIDVLRHPEEARLFQLLTEREPFLAKVAALEGLGAPAAAFVAQPPIPTTPVALDPLEVERDWADFGFSTRLKARLYRAKIRNLRQLLGCKPGRLRRLKGFGAKCELEFGRQQAAFQSALASGGSVDALRVRKA